MTPIMRRHDVGRATVTPPLGGEVMADDTWFR